MQNQLSEQEFASLLEKNLLDHKFLDCSCFLPTAKAIVTTRLSGESKEPYQHFNVAHHVGDDLAQVNSNRQYIKDYFDLSNLVFMDQTHSNVVKIVDSNCVQDFIFKADGLVTKAQNLGLAVMTADCLPLLLCDEQTKVVGAIHCGWKGILNGIIENAILQMEMLGAKRSQIKAYLGPAIGAKSFEVGEEVKDYFTQDLSKSAQAFVPEVLNQNGSLVTIEHKYMCDIYELTALYLQQSLGFKLEDRDLVIFGGGFDTKQQSSVFYSYREQKQTGRLASIIWLV